MNLEETIEYLENLLLDDTLSEEVKLGIEQALVKLKRDRTIQTLKDVLEIIAALLGISSGLS